MIDRKKMRFSASKLIKKTGERTPEVTASYDEIYEWLSDLSTIIGGVELLEECMGKYASLRIGETYTDPFREVTVKRIA